MQSYLKNYAQMQIGFSFLFLPQTKRGGGGGGSVLMELIQLSSPVKGPYNEYTSGVETWKLETFWISLGLVGILQTDPLKSGIS